MRSLPIQPEKLTEVRPIQLKGWLHDPKSKVECVRKDCALVLDKLLWQRTHTAVQCTDVHYCRSLFPYSNVSTRTSCNPFILFRAQVTSTQPQFTIPAPAGVTQPAFPGLTPILTAAPQGSSAAAKVTQVWAALFNCFAAGFPLGLENLEKMGRHFPVREKSGKSNKILENSSNFRQMLFIIFSDI